MLSPRRRAPVAPSTERHGPYQGCKRSRPGSRRPKRWRALAGRRSNTPGSLPPRPSRPPARTRGREGGKPSVARDHPFNDSGRSSPLQWIDHPPPSPTNPSPPSHRQCWCSDTDSYASLGESNSCGMRCAGDSSQACGGFLALSVYENDGEAPPAAAEASASASASYLGCFEDSQAERVMATSFSAPDMTNEVGAPVCAPLTSADPVGKPCPGLRSCRPERKTPRSCSLCPRVPGSETGSRRPLFEGKRSRHGFRGTETKERCVLVGAWLRCRSDEAAPPSVVARGWVYPAFPRARSRGSWPISRPVDQRLVARCP